MSRFLLFRTLSALGFALALGTCASNQFGNSCPIPDNATPAQREAASRLCLGQVASEIVDARLHKDVDILFLIDNSPSMSPKQAALGASIPKFIRTIDSTGANYHVGIATSNIGSTPPSAPPWGTFDGCDSFEGDNGVLQNLPCTAPARKGVSAEATDACKKLCPPGNDKYVPTDGSRYIWKNSENGTTNIPQHLVLDPGTMKMVDQGPIDAFQCMALVGDVGCGIEGQLEGMRRALTNTIENKGFLRPNSVLAVIFITDEDDCSVQMNRRAQNDPSSRDCATPDQKASFECYKVDYRCMATDLQCDQPMNTPGAKTNCKEREDTYLEPVEKYGKFLSSLRRPDKLLISGIWTLPAVQSGGQLQIGYPRKKGSMTDPEKISPNLNRDVGGKASCVYSGDAEVFGQAQYRLSKFARLFGDDAEGHPNALEVSICDIDHYEDALGNIAKAIKKKLTTTCLPVTPQLLENAQPNCQVGDVDEGQPESTPDILMPTCSKSCCDAWANSTQPTISDMDIQTACMPEAKDCYCAVPSTKGVCSNTVVAGVWRQHNAMPPIGKVVNFRCAGN